jgi:TetR/AcrR family transcriptional repressor of lmrAB and yxaGH operons
MPRRTDTRALMVATAAHLLRRQGLHSTGTSQILAESNAPRGSLYFHFPEGKEQLAIEALALSGRELGERMSAELDAAPAIGDGIVRLGEMFARSLLASEFRDGCPIATTALEAAESVAIRTACATVYDAWSQGLSARLEVAGATAQDATRLAQLVLSSIQGALILARVQRDPDVVRQVTQDLAEMVTGLAPSEERP